VRRVPIGSEGLLTATHELEQDARGAFAGPRCQQVLGCLVGSLDAALEVVGALRHSAAP
jgi:hypothetical protein